MNRQKYLRRIGIEENDPAPNLQNLRRLQKQHLLNVPFENLDIHWKTPILLDENKFAAKIIGEKRGGFCYELNGLFNELLTEIGFQSDLISARVANGENLSAEYDHLAILTEIDGEKYLVDVGFGDFSVEPLKLITDVEQKTESGVFKIRKYDREYFETVKKNGDIWKSEYFFTTLPRDLSEFAAMCEFHQTSPESHFTQGKICSILTADGRKTLTDKKFIKTKNNIKTEKEINSEFEFDQILRREFRIEKI